MYACAEKECHIPTDVNDILHMFICMKEQALSGLVFSPLVVNKVSLLPRLDVSPVTTGA